MEVALDVVGMNAVEVHIKQIIATAKKITTILVI